MPQASGDAGDADDATWAETGRMEQAHAGPIWRLSWGHPEHGDNIVLAQLFAEPDGCYTYGLRKFCKEMRLLQGSELQVPGPGSPSPLFSAPISIRKSFYYKVGNHQEVRECSTVGWRLHRVPVLLAPGRPAWCGAVAMQQCSAAGARLALAGCLLGCPPHLVSALVSSPHGPQVNNLL